MTAKEIIKELFPNCPVSGREDMVDYNPQQLKTHLELSVKSRYQLKEDAFYNDEYLVESWQDFTGWTYDCGFRIHRDRITFWAKYKVIRNWFNCGTREHVWTVYQCT